MTLRIIILTILFIDEEENIPDEISIQKADKIKSSKPDKNKRNESETELPNEEELPLDVKVGSPTAQVWISWLCLEVLCIFAGRG